MARPRKEGNDQGGENPLGSYVSQVRILFPNKSVIEKGVDVQVPDGKLEDWLKRGLIKEKEKEEKEAE